MVIESYRIFKDAIIFLMKKKGSRLTYAKRLPIRKINTVQFTARGVRIKDIEVGCPNTMLLPLSEDLVNLARKVA